MVNPYSIAGTLIVVVALAGAWRAWVAQAREAGFMDAILREAGHVPPETDPERTTWVPLVKADVVLDYGSHSRGVVGFRHRAYSGRHHLVGVS